MHCVWWDSCTGHKFENRIGFHTSNTIVGNPVSSHSYSSADIFSKLLKRLEPPVPKLNQNLQPAAGAKAVVGASSHDMKSIITMSTSKPIMIKQPIGDRLAAMSSLTNAGNSITQTPDVRFGDISVTGLKSARMLQWIRDNQNSNTRRTYDSGFRGFQSYLRQEGIELSDIQPVDIADYLRQRFEHDGVAASTIAGDRAAIADALKYQPTERVRTMHLDPIVCDTMKLCMTKAAQRQPKQHVSAQLMKELVDYYMLTEKLCTNLCLTTPSSQVSTQMWMNERNVCLMLVMMTAMLRESEAVALKQEDVFFQEEPSDTGAAAESVMSVVPFNHVAWVGPRLSQVALVIRQSKTDQRKIGADVLLSVNTAVPHLCPVRRLQHYLVACQKASVQSEYLFCKADGTQLANSTPCGIVQRVVEELNQWAQTKGEGVEKWGPAQLYGSHSLRRGGVTEARLSGVDMFDIKQHGRWKSMAVYGYVGPTVNEKLSVTRNLFGNLGTTAPAAAAGLVSQLPSSSAVVTSAGLMWPGRILTGTGRNYGAAEVPASHYGIGGVPGALPVRHGLAEKLAWAQMKAKARPVSHSLNYFPRELLEDGKFKRAKVVGGSPAKKSSTSVTPVKEIRSQAQVTVSAPVTNTESDSAMNVVSVPVVQLATPKRGRKGGRTADSDEEDYKVPLKEGELDEDAIAALQMEEWQQGYGSGASEQPQPDSESQSEEASQSNVEDEPPSKVNRRYCMKGRVNNKSRKIGTSTARKSRKLRGSTNKRMRTEASEVAAAASGELRAGSSMDQSMTQRLDGNTAAIVTQGTLPGLVTAANSLPRASKRKAMENMRAAYA